MLSRKKSGTYNSRGADVSALAGAKYLRFLLTMTRAATKMLTRKTTIKKKTKKRKMLKPEKMSLLRELHVPLKLIILPPSVVKLIAKGAKTRVGFHEV
jgi:hypothetical protein